MLFSVGQCLPLGGEGGGGGKEAACNPSADSLIHPEIKLTHTAFPFALYPSALEPIACEQALHLGEPREVTREQHAKGETSARSRVLSPEMESLLAAVAGYGAN